MEPKNNTENNLYSEIEELLSVARQEVLNTVNQTMVYTYYEIGKIIIEHEQGGKERAKYGKSLLKNIPQKLSGNYGKGFSVDNIGKYA